MILGIELGSTRIKSVLIDENAKVLAQGAYEWENTLVDGLWSYSMGEVDKGLKECYNEGFDLVNCGADVSALSNNCAAIMQQKSELGE